MLKVKQKLLKDYGDPMNNLSSKEFRADLNDLIKAVREDAAKTVETMCKEENDNVACIVCRDQAAAIRRK